MSMTHIVGRARLPSYASRGGKAGNRSPTFKLVRVEGEVVTMAQILERTGLPLETAQYSVKKLQKADEPITWAKLVDLRPNVKRDKKKESA
jgi:hypothetical protein